MQVIVIGDSSLTFVAYVHFQHIDVAHLFFIFTSQGKE